LVCDLFVRSRCDPPALSAGVDLRLMLI